jgi:hypothetical protein
MVSRLHKRPFYLWLVCFPSPHADSCTWYIYIWCVPRPPPPAFRMPKVSPGILTLQPTSQPETKVAGFFRHQTAMLFIGFPVIALGTSSVVYNKYLHGSEHATTWHGVSILRLFLRMTSKDISKKTLGFTCVFWLLGQIFIGVGSAWNDGALFGGGAKAKALWKYHRCVCTLTAKRDI